MKQWMTTAAAIALLAGVSAANAQSTPSSTTNKDDQKMEQSTSKQSTSKASKQHASVKKNKVRHKGGTTGAGDRTGAIGAPRNDPSIHQSIQRDSRGTPKGPGSDYNK